MDKSLQEDIVKRTGETYSVVVHVNPPNKAHYDFGNDIFWDYVNALESQSSVRMSKSEAMLALADKNLLTKIGNLSYGIPSTKIWNSSQKEDLIKYLAVLEEPRIFKPRLHGRPELVFYCYDQHEMVLER